MAASARAHINVKMTMTVLAAATNSARRLAKVQLDGKKGTSCRHSRRIERTRDSSIGDLNVF